MRKLLIIVVLMFVLVSCGILDSSSRVSTMKESAKVYPNPSTTTFNRFLNEGDSVEVVARTGERCQIHYYDGEGWTECDQINNVPDLEEFEVREVIQKKPQNDPKNDVPDPSLMNAWPGIIAVLVVVLIWGIFNVQNKKAKRIKEAKSDYLQALSLLKELPNDTDARQEALKLGRIYTDLARNDKRTMFDEVALMNDLNAIQPTTIATPTKADIVENEDGLSILELRLGKLKELMERDLITESEYRERRASILDEI